MVQHKERPRLQNPHTHFCPPVVSVSKGHYLPSQPKESSSGQNHHQEEIIHKLALQLRNIGDSIDCGMVQENDFSHLHFQSQDSERRNTDLHFEKSTQICKPKFSQELKVQDQDDRKGRLTARNQRNMSCAWELTHFSTVGSKPYLTGGSPTCTWSICLLPLSRAEDGLSWVWLSEGDGQLATDVTCQAHIGPSPGPQLR
ncbi:peroxisomal testis-specific protein 1 [Lontra canadensis]|uniref:peroxisomal testis-specific protein 1 n=1 Tax=Lontra canadensis TaxID=76717 RepID=UPI0013F31FA9|nr:peroxisomal testis-specific protein 1 [Lontra canadensis]